MLEIVENLEPLGLCGLSVEEGLFHLQRISLEGKHIVRENDDLK